MGGQGGERVSIHPPHFLSLVPSSSSFFQNGIFPVGPVLTSGWDNMGPLPGPGSFPGRRESRGGVSLQLQATGLWPGPTFSWRDHVPLPCEESFRARHAWWWPLRAMLCPGLESSPELPLLAHSPSVTLAAIWDLSGPLCGSEERRS